MFKKAVKISPPRVDYYAFGGGLDLVSPAIQMSPGKVFDSQNYYPEISGGYRRIDGYERYDGRPAPSSASYWVYPATITGTITVGATLTGATSGATARILGAFGSTLVLGRVTGTFTSTEALQISGVTVATAAGSIQMNGASDPSDDADYALLAANDLRTDIQQVPGSGPIRGVWVYNDVVYAFRDNAGGTAGNMWKATSSGWVQVQLGSEIQFTAATGQINVGDTIVGATSGATAQVLVPVLRTGTWTVSGVGTLVIGVTSGTFVSGELLKVGGTAKATSSSAATAITRLPGGQLDMVNGNFTGLATGLKMYGADGVNLAFEFDGTNYVPLRTGMSVDTPAHIMFHKLYLFLSFSGSIQFSGIGDPHAWSVVVGAGEIATGSACTGFLPQGGTSSGAALAIYTRSQTYILYGSSKQDFVLTPSMFDLGYAAFTMQQVSNNAYGLTSRGVQALITTLTYGDFDYSSITHLIQPLMAAKRGMETASTTSKTLNQYRLFFSDGTGIVIGMTGDKVQGCMPLNYGKVVRCMSTHYITGGAEVCYFGSDDGYVYQDNIGTSQDGQPIEAWIRPAFNNLKSPQIRKRFLRAVFEVKTYGYSSIQIGNDLGYATPDLTQGVIQSKTLVGAGGYWDQVVWNQFTWDTAVVATPGVSLDGTEKNISFLFYSNRAQDKAHTVQGVNLHYLPRRVER